MNAEQRHIHTPGPWAVEHDDDSDEDFNHWEWPCRIHNPELPARDGDSTHQTYTVCEFQDLISEADAALIAAAPDLLAAVKALLATGLNGGNNVRLAYLSAKQTALSDEDLAKADKAEEAMQMAYAAIAKATTPIPQ